MFYRVIRQPERPFNPHGLRLEWLWLSPTGGMSVRYANGWWEHWHAAPPCLQYHAVNKWDLRNAAGETLSL